MGSIPHFFIKRKMNLYFVDAQCLDYLGKSEKKGQKKEKQTYIDYFENISGHDYFLPLISKN